VALRITYATPDRSAGQGRAGIERLQCRYGGQNSQSAFHSISPFKCRDRVYERAADANVAYYFVTKLYRQNPEEKLHRQAAGVAKENRSLTAKGAEGAEEQRSPTAKPQGTLRKRTASPQRREGDE
jgi:hypothetical protein